MKGSGAAFPGVAAGRDEPRAFPVLPDTAGVFPLEPPHAATPTTASVRNTEMVPIVARRIPRSAAFPVGRLLSAQRTAPMADPLWLPSGGQNSARYTTSCAPPARRSSQERAPSPSARANTRERPDTTSKVRRGDEPSAVTSPVDCLDPAGRRPEAGTPSRCRSECLRHRWHGATRPRGRTRIRRRGPPPGAHLVADAIELRMRRAWQSRAARRCHDRSHLPRRARTPRESALSATASRSRARR